MFGVACGWLMARQWSLATPSVSAGTEFFHTSGRSGLRVVCAVVSATLSMSEGTRGYFTNSQLPVQREASSAAEVNPEFAQM